MEGRAGNFEKVLSDFQSKLAKAEFVAIDTELTGVDIDGEHDTFEESADRRIEKLCRVAERYTLIQLGITVVSRVENAMQEGLLSCSSYNLFAFPYVSAEMRRDPVFMCQASALRFNAQHRVDFNTWISQGVPYMSKEDEKQLKAVGYSDEDLEQKVGLLRFWKMLCAARLPLVVHTPVDLFFLLSTFEQNVPWRDPRALAILIRQCTPKVFDTAHLHGAFGRFRRLALSNFLEDAKARHDELAKDSSTTGVGPVEFILQGDTARRYNKSPEQMAHEAGYDSLMTAQLFVYLRAINASRIREAANKLFLYRSIDYIDLDRAGQEGIYGSSMFDLSRVTLLVARLEGETALGSDGRTPSDAPIKLIAAAGAEYKMMDTHHILVIIRASGGTAIRKAAEIASKVTGVESWLPFEHWKDAQAAQRPPTVTKVNTPATASNNQVAEVQTTKTVVPKSETPSSSSPPNPTASRTLKSDASSLATKPTSPEKSTAVVGAQRTNSDGQILLRPAELNGMKQVVDWLLRALGVGALGCILAAIAQRLLVRLRRRLRSV